MRGVEAGRDNFCPHPSLDQHSPHPPKKGHIKDIYTEGVGVQIRSPSTLINARHPPNQGRKKVI